MTKNISLLLLLINMEQRFDPDFHSYSIHHIMTNGVSVRYSVSGCGVSTAASYERTACSG
jgi:hypothetical protein